MCNIIYVYITSGYIYHAPHCFTITFNIVTIKINLEYVDVFIFHTLENISMIFIVW